MKSTNQCPWCRDVLGGWEGKLPDPKNFTELNVGELWIGTIQSDQLGEESTIMIIQVHQIDPVDMIYNIWRSDAHSFSYHKFSSKVMKHWVSCSGATRITVEKARTLQNIWSCELKVNQ